MMKRRFAKMLAIACVSMLAICALCACGNQAQNAAQQAQEANRAYMTSVNKVASELQTELEALSASITRGDTVTVVAKAKDALSVLDKLDDIEAPEALADIHEHFKAGCGHLREALEGYVGLYANGASMSNASYSAELSRIQGLYNDGIAELKQADELAAAKE